jgi:dipeptidyl aminopeptidase/acylaminoacyl peptidase
VLQALSFPVEGTMVEAVLHLPEGPVAGGVVTLGGRGSGLDGGRTAVCAALAAAGLAALRFGYRDGSDLTRDLADAAGAVRLLRAHPAVPQRTGLYGHSHGGALAGVVAGRDSRIRAAVLAAPPAEREHFGTVRPLAELSRTRARVLLIAAGADTVVPPGDAGRYAALLRTAGVSHRLVTIDGADHDFSGPGHQAALLAATTAWLRDALAG